MKIIYKKIAEIKPYNRNNKIHSERQVRLIAESIKEFGFKNPIIIDKNNTIIAGHGRYEAAKLLNLSEVPCILANDLTSKQVKAYRIADNKLADLGEYDLDALDLELEEIKDDFDLEMLGIGTLIDEAEEIEEIDEITEDEAPEKPKKAFTKKGDLWILGRHRVMCGDSTKQEDVDRLVGNEKIDLFITDPPYNLNYEGKTKEKLKIINDHMENGAFREFLRQAFSNADEKLKEGGVFYIWHADTEGYNFRGACYDVGWKISECLVWVKDTFVLGRQDYHWKHEPCLYGWKEGAAHYWGGDRKQTTVIDFSRPKKNEQHPTMKPVGLFAYQIKNSSKKDDNVLDLFGGSGTTIIACEELGRKAFVMEFDEKYVDVIVERYYNLGKKDIRLIRNGEEYNWEGVKDKLLKRGEKNE